MPNYRRTDTPGATWFFTVNLLERHGNDLLVREHRSPGRAQRNPGCWIGRAGAVYLIALQKVVVVPTSASRVSLCSTRATSALPALRHYAGSALR